MGVIGSGSEFVENALQRDEEMGMGWPTITTLVDCFISAVMYLGSANRSLTVNDKLTCGIMRGGQTYLFGEPSTVPLYVPPAVAENWPLLADSHFPAAQAPSVLDRN